MKKVLASLGVLCLFSITSFSQMNGLRPKTLGVSFIMNDFTTPQRIRNGSMERVIRDKSWAKFADMAPGLALTYYKGLQKHMDFAGTLGASFVKYPFPSRPESPQDAMLLEADASINIKLFTDKYWVTPYMIAGVGASKYKAYYGAFIPLGGGFNVNLFEGTALFVTTQYRIPVTAENNNYHFTYSLGIAGTIGKNRIR